LAEVVIRVHWTPVETGAAICPESQPTKKRPSVAARVHVQCAFLSLEWGVTRVSLSAPALILKVSAGARRT
jgi:hypothetical protein